jgi:hypothetical protein
MLPTANMFRVFPICNYLMHLSMMSLHISTTTSIIANENFTSTSLIAAAVVRGYKPVLHYQQIPAPIPTM